MVKVELEETAATPSSLPPSPVISSPSFTSSISLLCFSGPSGCLRFLEGAEELDLSNVSSELKYRNRTVTYIPIKRGEQCSAIFH